jgi:hypothetical protein
MGKSTIEHDPEIAAISDVYTVLKGLTPEAQCRVLTYVAAKLKVGIPTKNMPGMGEERQDDAPDAARDEGAGAEAPHETEDLEGISPVARRWITRSGLQPKHLSQVFSLGIDEIDLIAKTVPGKSKRERMRSVFLLKGIAAYLGAGAARFTHEEVKEACLHYDAYDPANFAAILKGLAGEVSGGKGTGYTLTPRGIASATEIVKTITHAGGDA